MRCKWTVKKSTGGRTVDGPPKGLGRGEEAGLRTGKWAAVTSSEVTSFLSSSIPFPFGSALFLLFCELGEI